MYIIVILKLIDFLNNKAYRANSSMPIQIEGLVPSLGTVQFLLAAANDCMKLERSYSLEYCSSLHSSGMFSRILFMPAWPPLGAWVAPCLSCMCVVCACVYVCECVCVCVVCVGVCVCACVHTSVCECVHACVRTCKCMCVWCACGRHLCMCVHVGGKECMFSGWVW